MGGLFIDLLQPLIGLQSLWGDGSLLYSIRSIALRELRIIKIAIFAKPFDDLIDVRLRSATSFQQALAQFRNRARLRGQQLRRARKHTLAGLCGIKRCCLPSIFMSSSQFWFSSVTSVVNHRHLTTEDTE